MKEKLTMINAAVIKYFIVLILLLACNNIVAANLIATVDKTRININDTLQLTLGIDKKVDQNTLDYSALNKDFAILSARPSSSSHYSFTNGKSKQTVNVTWRFELAPKRVGNIEIPIFAINNLKSNAISIAVTATNASNNIRPVTAEVIVSTKNPKQEQELLVTFRFGFINGARPNGFDFNLGNTGLDATTLGQNNFSRVVNGIQTNYVDVRYVIYPAKAGKTNIPRQIITANFRGKRYTARTEQVDLNVAKSMLHPKYQRAQWLPAKTVNIRSEWSKTSDDLEVGDPVSLSIIIEADGQRTTMIPNIKLPEVEGLSYYYDQPKQEQKTTKNTIQSTRIQSLAIIAKKEGAVVIPEIIIPWWNIDTKQWQLALIPKRKFNVKPASNLSGLPDSFQNTTLAIDLQNIEQQKQSASQFKTWQLYTYISLIVLAISLIINLFLAMQMRKVTIATKKIAKKKAQTKITEAKQWQNLLTSINHKNQTAIKNNLLIWVRIRFNKEKITDLSSLFNNFESENLKQQLDLINKNLFSNENNIVDWSIMKTEIKSLRLKPKKKAKNIVPDLYPT